MGPYLTTLLVSFLYQTGFAQSTIDLDDSQAVKPASGDDLGLPSRIGDIKPTRLLQGGCTLDVTVKDPELAVCHQESTSFTNLRLQELQRFQNDGFDATSEKPELKETRIEGGQLFTTYDLCGSSWAYGFCPESICEYDVLSVDLNRHCKFACRYGYCPAEVCQTAIPNANEDGKKKREEEGSNDLMPGVVIVPLGFNKDSVKNRDKNNKQYLIYKDSY
ncbi:Hypothetical protein NCS54_00468200 [Fusarium falciforme]|uniref:Hypothetical protein n=1 Tax=Fusarium falciforme TaxID=195108 RepID=UPI002301EBAD|nr:Hypothetical protein NCS54_00468200 [Fusarium falciforme]WAO87375.1 Hypothetical protein NCS54_00468200 [Fusarium falciforme]